MVTVAVDGMGHDDGPAAIVPGVKDAAAEGVRVLLCGVREQLEAELGAGVDGIEIVEAADVIESGDEPAAAVRAKPGSSMVTACRLVRDGSAAAVVSGGPTGAMLAASLLHVGRIRGISRPGIGVPLPAQGAPCLLIDSGANSDARAENLLQFGIMGSQFMRDVMGIDEPSVGLLSIGEEPSKGNAVTVEAHQLLAAADLSFAGNCEGRDVLSGRFQVVVADGFAGNVLLKGLEGAAAALLGEVRKAAESSTRAKIGGLLLRPALRAMRDRTEPDNYGGAYLLGLRGVVVIAHGNSGRKGVRNAIRIAARGAEVGVVGRMAERLAPDRPTSDLQAPAAINTVPQVTAPEIGDQ
jgi:glycerol-3-phosphate acyltransferase PlsX